MKAISALLFTSILFSHDLFDNIYSESYNALTKNLASISDIKKQLNKKYNELVDKGDFEQVNILINMKSKLDENWGQLFGLLEVLSITNDILLYSAYHECDVSNIHQNKPKFSKINKNKTKPNPSSKSLLNLAIAKLDIMNKAVTGMLKIEIEFFNRVAESEDEKTQTHLNELSVDINNILKDIKNNINKMVIT
jgi:hypothetical protein